MSDRANIRWATEADFDELGRVMFEAVHGVRSHYSEPQKKAWVREPRKGDDWNNRLTSQAIILQEDCGSIHGFMSLALNGYIDFAYIRPTAQGTGLFKKLYKRIEQKGLEDQLDRLWVHASLLAQPAFVAVGFRIIKKEQVELGGQAFDRFEMEKLFNSRKN